MMMRWIPGTFAGPSGAQFARERRWITEDSLGGFIISIGSPAELAAKTNALQGLSAVPLLFAADLEFGPGQRLIPGGGVFPPPMGIAAPRPPARRDLPYVDATPRRPHCEQHGRRSRAQIR